MGRFVEGTDRSQTTLFPECLDDWIDEDNPVRVIDAFEALDRWLAAYNATYLHSALGYRAPNVVEAEHLGHATTSAAVC